MKIKNYLDKNYPSINWNILSQLFEEEGIELTEEIRNYLNTTPWNTNGNILINWGIVGEPETSKTLKYKYKKDYTLEITEASPDGVYFARIDGDVFTDGTIGLVYEGKTYNLSPTMTSDRSGSQVNLYGDFKDGEPTFENCPVALMSIPASNFTNVLVQKAGTYTFSVLYGGDEDINFNPPGGTVVSDPTNPSTPR